MKIFAACSDQPANDVDWTNCNFVESLELSGVSLAGAQMSGVNLALANLEKSQINNANMTYGNFHFLLTLVIPTYFYQIYSTLIAIIQILIIQILPK